LVFQTNLRANEIKEFEIEGFSLGESLLNYYSEEKIQSFYKNTSYYRDNIFGVIFVDKKSNLYDRIQITLKPKDKKHTIFALEGIIDFDGKIEQCRKKREIIISDIEKIFSDYERMDDDGIYQADKTKNSFSFTSWFFLKSGGFISVECTQMGKEVREMNGWTDELSISITSEELETFLRGDPYN
jgi:hypothetical protein